MPFTGRAERISITLPTDMVSYLRQRAKQEDRPFSTVIKRVLEDGIMTHASRLVDTPTPYEVPDES